MTLPLGSVPAADPAAEPDAFVVLADDDTRVHFLDWGGPPEATGVLLVHGLSQTAWLWAPVARRRTFRRGEVVFHRDDLAESLHLIVKGRFAVRITTPLGETAMLDVIGPGEAFGELAVFASF